MRLEKIDDKILIWQTGRQKNEIEYDSSKDLKEYNRRSLANFEVFLKESDEIEESLKIKQYLGKIIRAKEIPELIPTGSYQINSSLQYLKGDISEYIEEYGLNLDPDFQRAHVWSTDQRIRFVEFVLQGGKTNPIYFNHAGWMSGFDGEFVVVDGKQRLTSLLMFLDNEFPVLKELDSNKIGFYAKDFDFIPHDIVIIINDLQTRKQVLEWYLQINKGNVAHTETEIQKVEELLKAEQ